MKLSNRLEEIIRMVPHSNAVADIGCDHAYVDIELVKRNISGKGIACDVNPGPLKIAEENIERAGYSIEIETRLGDGMKPLKRGEAETVVISGMGGDLILSILDHAKDLWFMEGNERHKETLIHTFVLSPQSELGKVRRYLHENFLCIVDESMIEEDGKYYTVMKVEALALHPEMADGEDYETSYQYKTAAEYEYGSLLLKRKDPVLLSYLQKERERYRMIYEKRGADNIQFPETLARKKQLNERAWKLIADAIL